MAPFGAKGGTELCDRTRERCAVELEPRALFVEASAHLTAIAQRERGVGSSRSQASATGRSLAGIHTRPRSRFRPRGMVIGMATRKLTITLDDEALEKVRALVAARKATSVSGFVQRAVDVALHDVAGWGAMLAEGLAKTGGPLTKAERAWADAILDAPAKRRRKRAA